MKAFAGHLAAATEGGAPGILQGVGQSPSSSLR
jgi:hypothetical protein